MRRGPWPRANHEVDRADFNCARPSAPAQTARGAALLLVYAAVVMLMRGASHAWWRAVTAMLEVSHRALAGSLFQRQGCARGARELERSTCRGSVIALQVQYVYVASVSTQVREFRIPREKAQSGRGRFLAAGCGLQPVRVLGVMLLGLVALDMLAGQVRSDVLALRVVGVGALACALVRNFHARTRRGCRAVSMLVACCEGWLIGLSWLVVFLCGAWAWVVPTFGREPIRSRTASVPVEITGLLLSVLGEPDEVENVLHQDWVQGWAGWRKLDGSDDASCVDIARRLLYISSASGHMGPRSNVERLQELTLARGNPSGRKVRGRPGRSPTAGVVRQCQVCRFRAYAAACVNSAPTRFAAWTLPYSEPRLLGISSLQQQAFEILDIWLGHFVAGCSTRLLLLSCSRVAFPCIRWRPQCTCASAWSSTHCTDLTRAEAPRTTCRTEQCQRYYRRPVGTTLHRLGGGDVPESPSWATLPLLLQACLLSLGVSESRWDELRGATWCVNWKGWLEVVPHMSDAAVTCWAERFLRLSAQDQNAAIGRRSDAERVQELQLEGLTYVPASGLGSNCLIDSLTIGLAAQGLLPGGLLSHSASRVKGCEACRRYLVGAQNVALRPRQRDSLGQELAVTAKEHAEAYLQPDLHGPAIVHFLLQFYGRPEVVVNVNFSIVQYTRFDGPFFDPSEMAVAVRSSSEMNATVVLNIYNQMDLRGNGFHFDALIANAPASTKQVPSTHASVAKGKTKFICERQHACRQATCTDPTHEANARSQENREACASMAVDCADSYKFDVSLQLGQPPSDAVLHNMLQGFLQDRGSTLMIGAADVAEVRSAWFQTDTLANVLLTKLQATVCHSDSTIHAARKLVAAWRRYVFVRNQGPGRKLGSSVQAPPPHETQEKKSEADKEMKMNLEAANGSKDCREVGRRQRSPKPGSVPSVVTRECSTGRGRKRMCAQALSTAALQGQLPHLQPKSDDNAEPMSKRRRYCGKQRPRPEDRMNREGSKEANTHMRWGESEAEEDQFVLRTLPTCKTDDPRAKEDQMARDIARNLLQYPTLPEKAQVHARSRAAHIVPDVHCAFSGCAWCGDDHVELQAHLQIAHTDVLGPLARSLCDRSMPKAAAKVGGGQRAPDAREDHLFDAYRLVLDVACQSEAPLACTALDRRCLRQLSQELREAPPESRVCMLCAQRFPYARSSNMEIWFSQALRTDEDGCTRFLGLTADATVKLLGRQTYISQYVDQSQAAQSEHMLADLAHWTCQLQFSNGEIEIISCPEDKVCATGCDERRACANCWMPLCRNCRKQVSDGSLPKQALANDLLVFYAPRELYEHKVTMLELVCASPCMTSLICFSLEKKYRNRHALDERAHMQRHRQGARGNATTFLLDWEGLLEEFQAYEKDLLPADASRLPRAGNDLQKFISVLLKTSDDELQLQDLSRLIHQARVRRRVVVLLIENACARGHPAFTGLDLQQMRDRAAKLLPEDDVPPEVVALLQSDGSLDQIERQKVATPCAAPGTVEEAAVELDMRRPNSVVLERSGHEAIDYEAQRIAAVRALAETAEEDLLDAGSEQEAGPAPEKEIISTSEPLDQFAPWYFGVAFAYLFQYCTAMPDPPEWGKYKDKRWRRPADAPRVPLQDWVRLMSRRVESQLGRDWTFGYTTWNVLFRSAVNLSRSVYSYNTPMLKDDGTWGKLTAAALEDAACEILRALHGTYTTADGKELPVKGSLTLVQYSTGLTATARRILVNLNHTARIIPGTQEARRTMRFEIQAMRIRYGTPIFVTVTPDEAHSLMYVRMARHRRTDPVRLTESNIGNRTGDRDWPRLDADLTVSLPMDTLEMRCPNWEERRRILARDPLATVDGFRVTMLLVLRHLFGMNVCLDCPDCNCRALPCQDARGSNATVNGGIFGRCDAAYVAIEFQKSQGSPHGHIQLFVQCLHQHETVQDIFAMVEERAAQLREDYLRYETHVRRCVYERDDEQVDQALTDAERRWPEYKTEKLLISRPTYQNNTMTAEHSDEEAERWSQAYLREDVFRLQILKQNHVHIPDPLTGDRQPQPGCLKVDRPKECKHGYPRTAEMTQAAVVLCPCRLKAMQLPASGRKNCIAMLHGPRDNAYLNATHPALLAGFRCNSDVQLPYRLPYTCDVCAAPLAPAQMRKIVTSAQRAQDAQTGYCCDYCAKSQPMAFAELKELQKGHARLAEQIKERGLEYQGKRHMTRFMSDAYCKGIVRGQAECCNLRSHYKEGDATCAEKITTTQYVAFPGHEYLRYAELATSGESDRKKRVTATALGRDTRAPRQKQATERDHAEFYARRPRHRACWHLSPYEPQLYWEVIPTRAPRTWSKWMGSATDAWDVTLTKHGENKLRVAGGKGARLVPGVDTNLRPELADDYLPFEDCKTNIRVRAAWLLRKRRRPRCPSFAHCPVPRYQREQQEQNSFLCLVYFCAWTGLPDNADGGVPHVAALKGRHPTWEAAFRAWLLHLPCKETQRHVSNFLSVYRVRSLTGDVENSDNDDADEAGVRIHAENFRICLATRSAEPTAQTKHADEYEDLNRTWTQTASPQTGGNIVLPREENLDIRKLLKEARASGRECTSFAKSGATHTVREASIRDRGVRATTEAVQDWLASLAVRKDEHGRLLCNSAQRSFVGRVAERILHEMQTGEAQGGAHDNDHEPLRWVLHGGPGTGKTHAIKLLRAELFEDILQWQSGVHFQIAALQAVTADMLDGDTLHHAFGLSWGKSSDDDASLAKSLGLAKRMLQMRWLIIDEISMVSIELLARLERTCRKLVRSGSPFKRDMVNQHSRPFGGLNIIVVGDLWQLEPPQGHFLASLPHEWLGTAGARQQLLVAQGQELVWGPPELGLQGMTELVECERTKDEWLQEVQEEFRYSQLSTDNHAFLHGISTSVPGSWLRGRAACGNIACQGLAVRKCSSATILTKECERCRAERSARCRVATSVNDSRFLERFVAAPSIFATNVRKCHTNKVRAEAFAMRSGRQLHYVVAQDRASAAVLREKPDLAEEKLRWLQRHDRECGDLCGMLPLCEGMPVFLTDHINRSRLLLKGRRGYVVGWRPATDGAVQVELSRTVWNQLPQVVYVRFPGATWQLTGLEIGVYPIVPQRKPWFLDSKRKHPCLKISRIQLPLLPAFAITAHQAQGQTIEEGVIADLSYGTVSNALTAYIAITRVKSREDLLILRPFEAAAFQQGDTSFRNLLLQHWQRHDLDWGRIVQRYVRTKTCSECHAERLKAAFTAGQWKQLDGTAVCRECTKTYRERGTPYRCRRCQRWQAAEAFPGPMANFLVWRATCLMCIDKRQCGTCQQWCDQTLFTTNGWEKKRDRVCAVCRQHLRYKVIVQKARQRLRRRAATVHAKERSERRQRILSEVRVEIQRRAAQGRSSSCVSCGVEIPLRNEMPDSKQCRACRHQFEGPYDPSQRYAFAYDCPRCRALVKSNTGDGCIDNRHNCGHQFKVQNGRVLRASASTTSKHEYECPQCKAKVESDTRDGCIDNRRNCGHQFNVRNGRVVRTSASTTSMQEYECPQCKAKVESETRDGCIDNRRTCGHQFNVRSGRVVRASASTTGKHEYTCPQCKAKVESDTRDGCIDNRRTCGHQFNVRNGQVVRASASTTSMQEYECPQCKAKVESETRDGCINNRRNCGHQFNVRNGRVVRTSASTTSKHEYTCPQCKAKVESETQDGCIDNRRNCGHQFNVRNGHVVRAFASTTNMQEYECPQCKAKVESDTRDGCIDNRRNCGHQFNVRSGRVVRASASTTSKHEYKCPQCKAKVESDTRHGCIDNRRSCGHQFNVRNGRVVVAPRRKTKRHQYTCPQCKARVESKTRNGRLDNRRSCGHQFNVRNGRVVAARATKKTMPVSAKPKRKRKDR